MAETSKPIQTEHPSDQPSIDSLIAGLLSYGKRKGLIEQKRKYLLGPHPKGALVFTRPKLHVTVYDETVLTNKILDYLDLDSYRPAPAARLPIDELLKAFSDYQISRGLLQDARFDREQFETGLIALLAPMPAELIKTCKKVSKYGTKLSTDTLFKISKDLHYIKEEELKKDIKWSQPSKYGELEITINLGKPEKDPEEIRLAARENERERYPKCAICKENEGYRGKKGVSEPRQNLRLIPIFLNKEPFYLQFSPYQYFDEHCIVLHETHKPMVINKSTFKELFDFVDQFDHYIIGSNADLPIVGGSILSHHHFQGGKHIFPIEKAETAEQRALPGFKEIILDYLYWPIPTLRLRSLNKEQLIEAAAKILAWWKGYEDKAFNLISQDENGRHNTITPILRKEEGLYSLYLLLRNNGTSDEYPDGIFHVHPQYYPIKKENLGLIEAAGLAILPARLNTEDLDQDQIGKSFEKILECAMIFPLAKKKDTGEIEAETSFLDDLIQFFQQNLKDQDPEKEVSSKPLNQSEKSEKTKGKRLVHLKKKRTKYR